MKRLKGPVLLALLSAIFVALSTIIVQLAFG